MSAAVPPNAEHIELTGVTKRFGGTVALADVDLTIGRGTVHALVGENGAGKSTLGKIVAGVHQPSAGTVAVDGTAVRYRSPHDALADGITIVQQEIALVPHRSVLENVFLGQGARRLGFVGKRANRRAFAQLVKASGFELDPDARAGELRIPEQQQVEVLRAMVRQAKLIVFDEPTASLTRAESERLRGVVRDLRAAGTTVVFVSHDLDEVLELADTVTVLRNGRLVRTGPAAAETKASLVTAMLGRDATVAFPVKTPPSDDADVILRVRGLSRRGVIDDICFDIRRGEIVALAGLVGSGRSEVARALFGADAHDAGTIDVGGRTISIARPKDAIRAGIALLPESRKDQGLLMLRAAEENVTLADLPSVTRLGVVDRRREREMTEPLLSRLAVKTAPGAPIETLSGGNQQKVLFAKWLYRQPRVLVADEPTRGVDIGAKLEIYRLLVELAQSGLAVLLISSELEEVVGLAHRVLVMRRGRIVAELAGTDLSEASVLGAAFGQETAAA